MHAHQRTSARILRASPSSPQTSSGSLPDAARSAPAGTAKSTASSGDPSWAAKSSTSVQEDYTTGKSSSSHESPQPDSSPGVRLRDDLSYEPVLHVGLDETNLGEATNDKSCVSYLYRPCSYNVSFDARAGGVYASADAARVGGGLYYAVVEALCTLATDPSPQVSRGGQRAMRAAQVELVTLTPQRPQTAAPSSPARPSQAASQPQAAAASSAHSASTAGMSSFLPKSWQSKSWRSFSQTPSRSASVSASSELATSNISPSFAGIVPGPGSRIPFILRRVRSV